MINVDVKLEFDKIFNEVLEKKKHILNPTDSTILSLLEGEITEG